MFISQNHSGQQPSVRIEKASQPIDVRMAPAVNNVPKKFKQFNSKRKQVYAELNQRTALNFDKTSVK